MRFKQRLLWWGLAAAVLAVAAISSISAFVQAPHIVVKDQHNGTVYYSAPVKQGMTVTLSWIHSIEHQPWTETYIVDNNEFILKEISVKSYGAGVPANPGGVTTVEDGVIHVRGLNQRFNDLKWVHSHDTNYTVRVGDHLIQTEDIDHHAFVELSIKE
ncbi:MAG: DUF1850 domain-containing protein [Actinomycetaceae bacterium]|nr:DUF1850 domain-containing protein [Actinomycetaceae bacterium]